MTQPADDTHPTRADVLKYHAHVAMQNFKQKQPDTYRHLVAHHMLLEAAIENELGRKMLANELRILRIGLKEGWIACQERLLELKHDQQAIDEFLSTLPPKPE